MKDSMIGLQEVGQDRKWIVLSLNRTKQLNAIGGELLEELRQQLERVAGMEDAVGLIIGSASAKAFSSGINTAYVQGLSNEEAAAFFARIADTLERISRFPYPTIAAVSGYALGAGADLALACDFRIADATARFRFPGPQFGVVLGTQRLAHEVGPAAARRLALWSPFVDAEQALQCGLVHEIAGEGGAMAAALDRAEQLSRLPKHAMDQIRRICGPEAVGESSAELARQSIREGDFQRNFALYLESVRKK